ncbi:hypothetical protein ACXR0O_02205 [Verrucomicrobiota bacterium sgz303538]
MLEGVDLEACLRERSTSVETVGGEQHFYHPTGCSSSLIRRSDDKPLPPFVCSSPLRGFYERYAGASIGDCDLMFATPTEGGIPVSQGYTLADFVRVRSVAAEYSVEVPSEEILFLVSFGWMFFYGYIGGRLRVHDRDFGTVRDTTLRAVLDEWWEIATENPV